MKKRVTVTVGVPAYNEEQNISTLLESVLWQKRDGFRLEKVIVVTDGCSDSTAAVVRTFIRNHRSVTVQLVEGKTRKGKAHRLNQLYRLNTSDILMTVDADILLKDKLLLKKMVKELAKKDVVVVGANNQPVEAKTFVERVYNAGYQMWYEVRKDYKNGQNVNNFHGMMMGMTKEFAQSIKLPGTSGDGPYVCFMAWKQGKKFRFVKKATVLFNSVDNLADYFLQASRNVFSTDDLASLLGEYVYTMQRIPFSYKLLGVVKTFARDPFYTGLAIALNILIRVIPVSDKKRHTNGIWEIARSTKTNIITH